MARARPKKARKLPRGRTSSVKIKTTAKRGTRPTRRVVPRGPVPRGSLSARPPSTKGAPPPRAHAFSPVGRVRGEFPGKKKKSKAKRPQAGRASPAGRLKGEKKRAVGSPPAPRPPVSRGERRPKTGKALSAPKGRANVRATQGDQDPPET